MSQSTATQAPLAIEEIAGRSSPGQLLLRRWLGAWIGLIVLFSLLTLPDFVLGSTLYRDILRICPSSLIMYFPYFPVATVVVLLVKICEAAIAKPRTNALVSRRNA